MVRLFASFLALVCVWPLAASAHGPSRQKVTESVEINAPADKVWAVIGNFQDMGWHPHSRRRKARAATTSARHVRLRWKAEVRSTRS